MHQSLALVIFLVSTAVQAQVYPPFSGSRTSLPSAPLAPSAESLIGSAQYAAESAERERESARNAEDKTTHDQHQQNSSDYQSAAESLTEQAISAAGSGGAPQ